ncbi:MAG: Fe(3+) ABC transporter substrate-binding protein [Kiritimatiellae bacterium]|jgi:iron(III) transport system substrate-binding protein|nr:Fe(3+) ABC transporter substrate-binding protein [Kiritimatiellia bacterium]
MQIKQTLYLTVIFFCAGFLTANEPLVVYSHRHYAADEKLFTSFTETTGIPVQVLKAGANELMERLKSEGDRTRADILITADAGRLEEAKAAGFLAPIQSETLTSRIPEPYRDVDSHWFGFTRRARVLVYAPDRVTPKELSTYEDLADPKWRGRLLCRSSNNIYNQSLLASMISANGEDDALERARDVSRNMARPPQGSDRDQIRAVAAGLGDVAIVNTYYLGLLLTSPDPNVRELAKPLRIFFPNQEGRGTHVNISGGGVLKSSEHKENAVRLLEFLVSDQAQKVFPATTYEYPVVEGVEWSDLQKSWGRFKADDLNLTQLGEAGKKAVQLFNLAGWE